jgi:hypothetical protein
MLKDLIKMAGRLDALGLRKEADFADRLIRKVALTEEDFTGKTIDIYFALSREGRESITKEEIDLLSQKAKELFIDRPYAAEHKKLNGLTDKDIPSGELLTFLSAVREDGPESISLRLGSTNFGSGGLGATFFIPKSFEESYLLFGAKTNYLTFITDKFKDLARQCLMETGLDGKTRDGSIRVVISS